MTCGLCGRFTRVEPLPPGWKSYHSLFFCPECRRQRFRLKWITLRLAEPVCKEFRIAFEKIWPRAGPLLFGDGAWQLTAAEGERFVRVLMRNQWWMLRLHYANWSRSRKDTFEKIAAGEVGTGELRFYHKPPYERSRNRRNAVQRYAIECRTVAWLPREPPEQPGTRARVSHARSARGDPVSIESIEAIAIHKLRRAIWANRISFPAQVPTFRNCGEPDRQRKQVQLYFLMGWDCPKIAARFELKKEQVRTILNTWKRRAANSGYLQDIPPAEIWNPLGRSLSSAPHGKNDLPPTKQRPARLPRRA